MSAITDMLAVQAHDPVATCPGAAVAADCICVQRACAVPVGFRRTALSY